MTSGCGGVTPPKWLHIARRAPAFSSRTSRAATTWQLVLVTTDIAEAIRGAELILCPAPAFAQPDIARSIAPQLADGQVVFLPPATFGSMIFAKAAHDAGNRPA